MHISYLARQVERVITDNSPAILTAVGVIGTVGTAYLSGRASFRAALLIDEERQVWRIEGELPLKMKAALVWKLYIPPVCTGLATVGAIIFANRISTRRAAALAAAYSVSERAYSEYKDKIVEKLGDKKEQEARDEIAQEKVTRTPVQDSQIISTNGGQELFLESHTGRYFYSDMETLRKAENDVNRNIYHNMHSSLSEFYDKIGLAHTDISDEVGWNNDNQLELYFTSTITDRGKPCIVMTYTFKPIREYHRLL